MLNPPGVWQMISLTSRACWRQWYLGGAIGVGNCDPPSGWQAQRRSGRETQMAMAVPDGARPDRGSQVRWLGVWLPEQSLRVLAHEHGPVVNLAWLVTGAGYQRWQGETFKMSDCRLAVTHIMKYNIEKTHLPYALRPRAVPLAQCPRQDSTLRPTA